MPSPNTIAKCLEKLFAKHGVSDALTVDMVKKHIYNSRAGAMEASHKYHKKFLGYFKEAMKSDHLANEILQVFTDAWNYFPHKTLGGKSPNEVYREMGKDAHAGGNRTEKPENKPDIIVGGRTMKWDDYWEMIKQMEKDQEPFKKWIDEEALPQYRKYLEQLKGLKLVDTNFGVAEIFFERALTLGFVALEQIHPMYVQQDYPKWFQTHVLFMNVPSARIRKSLALLFDFLEFVYEIDKKKYGF